MADLPAGAVTFLLTDIEGSTRLWEEHPDEMRAALARHDALATEAIAKYRGAVIKARGEGDSLFCVFARAIDAVAAALALQTSLCLEPWPAKTPLRVRIALHTGEAERRNGDYYGAVVNRCARLRAIAHGGQVLLSQATQALTGDDLPERAALRDLGAHRLKDLLQPEHAWQLVHPDLPSDFPPLRSLQAFANNLPLQLTSFIGRETEMAEVKRLLSTTRLLTLTGSGGCGKTRLALQVVADLMESYPDGVWLAELASLSDPALVEQAVAGAVGVREEPGRTIAESLLDYLRSRRLLLLLDNCEHLLDTCAHLGDRLLRECPNLHVLASSREALGIAGETTYRVPSLALPDPDCTVSVEQLGRYEAIDLFTDRASAAMPAFAVTPGNASALVQICRRLDGIPLALELAAARVRSLPIEQIAARLDDRFHLLTGGSRAALPRQQTLRALIDWSFNLLSQSERTLLCRLSAFSGGWTIEAAEAVCSGDGVEEWEALDLLTSLVDKSLAVFEERDGEARYRLLETVRQYAREKLLDSGHGQAVRERHSEYFLRLAEAAEPGLQGASQAAWAGRLERDHDNLRAALAWLSGERHLRLAAALSRFWAYRGYATEGRRWLDAATEAARGQRSGAPAPVRARVYSGAGTMAWLQQDYERAEAMHAASLVLFGEAGDRSGMAFSLNNLAAQDMNRGGYAHAEVLLKEALALSQESGDRYVEAMALDNLGLLADFQGDFESAAPLYQQSLACYQAVGDSASAGRILNHLGYSALVQEQYDRAAELLDESLATARESRDLAGLPYTLHSRAMAACHAGDLTLAITYLTESLTMCREQKTRWCTIDCLEGFGKVSSAQGDRERAIRLYAAAEAVRECIGAQRLPVLRAQTERELEDLRALLGEQAYDAVWAEGHAMTWEQAMDYALSDGSSSGAESAPKPAAVAAR